MPPFTEPSSRTIPATSQTKKYWVIGISAVIALGIIAGLGYVFFPSLFNPQFTKAETALAHGDYATATNSISKFLVTQPKNVDALILKSFSLSELAGSGTPEPSKDSYGSQAEATAQQAVALASKNSEAYRALGYAQTIEEKYEVAHQSYQKAIALHGQNALAYYDDAFTFFLEGNLTQAEAEYRVALKFDSTLAPAYADLGRLLSGNNDQVAALAEFKTGYVHTQNPHLKAVLAYRIGQILTNKRNFADAQTYVTEATTRDPTYTLGWYGLGVFVFSQASAAESASTTPIATRIQLSRTALTSIDNLNKSLSLDQNLSLAYYQLGIESYFFGQFKQGSISIDKAIATVPKDSTLSSAEKAHLLTAMTQVRSMFTTSVIKPK